MSRCCSVMEHRDYSSSEGWAGLWAEEILQDGVNKEENNTPEKAWAFHGWPQLCHGDLVPRREALQ